MANLQGMYDPNAEASGDYEPLPAGEYTAEIIDSEIEDISKNSNKGRCLKLTWKVSGGNYDGRLVWQRLNMWGENMTNNDKVVSIAQSQFASIRQATGKLNVMDSAELHHIPCTIRVTVRTDPNGQYAPQNEIKAVKAIGNGGGFAAANPLAGASQGQQQPSSQSSPAATNGGGGQQRPWG